MQMQAFATDEREACLKREKAQIEKGYPLLNGNQNDKERVMRYTILQTGSCAQQAWTCNYILMLMQGTCSTQDVSSADSA